MRGRIGSPRGQAAAKMQEAASKPAQRRIGRAGAKAAPPSVAIAEPRYPKPTLSVLACKVQEVFQSHRKSLPERLCRLPADFKYYSII